MGEKRTPEPNAIFHKKIASNNTRHSGIIFFSAGFGDSRLRCLCHGLVPCLLHPFRGDGRAPRRGGGFAGINYVPRCHSLTVLFRTNDFFF